MTNMEVALKVFMRMDEEGIDTEDWELDEVPVEGKVYEFNNKVLKQGFTINVDADGEIRFYFTLAWRKGMSYNSFEASSIRTAIKLDEGWERGC